MKDSTKHIIARELYFFFKWFAIGIAVAVLLSIIALVVGDVEPDWLGDAYGVLFISSFFLPIWLYLYRGVKWLVLWVNKWR